MLLTRNQNIHLNFKIKLEYEQLIVFLNLSLINKDKQTL